MSLGAAPCLAHTHTHSDPYLQRLTENTTKRLLLRAQGRARGTKQPEAQVAAWGLK